MMNDEIFMKEAIRLSQLAVSHETNPLEQCWSRTAKLSSATRTRFIPAPIHLPRRSRTAPAFLRRDAYHGFTRIYTLFQL